MHVLLAEDNRTNQILVSLVLEGQGFSVTVAENGRVALNLLQNQHFDVVLMDINMPEMDGYDVVRSLRARHAEGLQINHNVPIIAMTAHDGEDIRAKCLKAGMDDYIRKPIHADTLFETISQHIETLPTKPDKKAKSAHKHHTIEQTTPDDASTLLNLNQLRHSLGNNSSKLLKIIDAFVNRLPQDIEHIRQAFEHNDAENLERRAHALKGSIATFGAKSVAQLAGQLEQLGRERQFESAQPIFAQFKKAVEPLLDALLAEKQKLKTPNKSKPIPPPAPRSVVTPIPDKTNKSATAVTRILIAEDDYASQMVLEGFLEQWGYEVIVTTNGADAWQVMQEDNPPQIAVLDWMMPKLDGVEVCRRIREHIQNRYIYILLLTAKGLKEDRMLGFEAGADDYITKPFEQADLKARIDAGIRLIQQENRVAAQRDQLREDLQLGMEQSTQYVGLIHFMAELRKHEHEAQILTAVERYMREMLKIQVNLWERCADGEIIALGATTEPVSHAKQTVLRAVFSTNNKVIFNGRHPQYIKEDEFLLEIIESGTIDLSLDLLPLYMSHFHISLIAARQRQRINEEQARYRKLMENILPKTVAEELMLHGTTSPRFFSCVTVMFTDFAGFTKAARNWEPERVLKELGRYFDYFDLTTEHFRVEKLKTIGDGYMCAGGLPEENTTHAVDCVLAALELRRFVNALRTQRATESGEKMWEIRIGIHTGSVMAGVIGSKKFAYDIWGDTVNTASRMESTGVVGEINISESTYHAIKDFFQCEYRGEFEVKGKGLMKMYLVQGILPTLCVKDKPHKPNKAFDARYAELQNGDINTV